MSASFRRRMLTMSLLLIVPIHTTAQLPTVSDGMTIGEGSLTDSEHAIPTGPYATSVADISYKAEADGSSSTSKPTNSTITNKDATDTSTSSNTITFLTGTAATTTQSIVGNATETTSIASTTATNTRPCNNYPELCNRKYSNITEVGCHNSPFVRANNVASNQELDVTTQLDDGVRFLQAQIQWPSNDTVPHFCHTSCDILDAGPITDWLGKVKDWVDKHPYDVVTILLGNGNYSTVDLYAPYIESTGIVPYIYEPPKYHMSLDDWPTLGEMILNGKRVVMWIDYVANQTTYPWLLDEFALMWETPFDPVDMTFPCNPERPPNLSDDQAKTRIFIANHNLNVEVTAFGASILVPATSLLNTTNNITGDGSLGLATNNCVAEWGRPPNFLNVDYYNYGGYPGSVFEVQAMMNNVTYTRKCCGGLDSGANAEAVSWVLVMGIAVVVSLLMS